MNKDTDTLEALANPIRLSILQMLQADPHLNTDKIIEALPISREMATYHIRVLRRAGVIREAAKQHDERRVYYAIEAATITQAYNVLAGLVPRGKKSA